GAACRRGQRKTLAVGTGWDDWRPLPRRAFGHPSPGRAPGPPPRHTIQYFAPSYSLYPVLADIHGAAKRPIRLKKDFALPTVAELRRGRRWDFQAALTYITTPHAPSGRAYGADDLEALCRAQTGVVLLDEAYVAFAAQN